MRFEEKYFTDFAFTKKQITDNLNNAFRDLTIARRDPILEVKFNYAYTALLKSGIALLSFYQVRTKSVPGHHTKIIEKIAEILEDEAIIDIGNAMRVKRNKDLYAGGIEVTEKECKDYIAFIEKVFSRVKEFMGKKTQER